MVYSVNNKETVNLAKLEKMGMDIFSRTRSGNKDSGNKDSDKKLPVHLSVRYDKRRIRISVAKSEFETFLNHERFSFAVDRINRRMYFIPHDNGYKFLARSKNSRYETQISGNLFDELRHVKGVITGIEKQPNRKLLYDENVGLHYISLACDDFMETKI